jgi:hypothetical protein
MKPGRFVRISCTDTTRLWICPTSPTPPNVSSPTSTIRSARNNRLTDAFHEIRSLFEMKDVIGCRRYAKMKIINNGVIKFEKRVIKKVTMPRMTSPASNFVVDPQRGEDAESCAMIFHENGS